MTSNEKITINKTLISIFREVIDNDLTVCIQASNHPYLINKNTNDSSLTDSKTSRVLFEKKLLQKLCHHLNENNILIHTDMVKDSLTKYFFPILILFGLFGNLASFKVTFTRSRLKNEKHSLCLAILSFTNMLIIVLGPLREYVEFKYEMNIKSHSPLICRLVVFFGYMCSTYAAYTFSFIAYERWQAIKCPFDYKLKRRNSTRYQLGLLLAFSFMITMPYFLFPRLVAEDNEENNYDENHQMKCLLDKYYFELTVYDAILFFTIPYIIIIVYSTLSFNKLFKNSRLKKNIQTIEMKMSHAATNLDENLDIGADDERNNINAIERVNSKKYILPKVSSVLTSRRKMTLLLLFLPNFYLIMNLPVFIVILIEIFTTSYSSSAAAFQTLDGFDVAFHLARFLMYTNNCLNGLFFILSGDYFRWKFFRF